MAAKALNILLLFNFRLTYERDELLREIREKLFLFDAMLRLLRHEKIHLEVTLKNADLRFVWNDFNLKFISDKVSGTAVGLNFVED